MQPDMDTSPIVFDVETCGLPYAADYLDPVQPAKNLRDPDKIAADIAQRTAERDGKLGLDWNTGRIVALCWWTSGVLTTHVCRDEADEAAAIRAFWKAARNRTIVGFNIKGFDLRFLIQRSRYLGLPYPWVDMGRYSSKGVTDLYLELTFSDPYTEGAMRKTLKAFARRFGIPVADDVDGKEIGALVAAGAWDRVREHCESDVRLTVALAERLGVVKPQHVEVPA